MKLTNEQYLDFEDRFIKKYNRKMEIGNFTNEAAIRQTFYDFLTDIGLIENNFKTFIMNPEAKIKVEIVD